MTHCLCTILLDHPCLLRPFGLCNRRFVQQFSKSVIYFVQEQRKGHKTLKQRDDIDFYLPQHKTLHSLGEYLVQLLHMNKM